MNDSESSPLRTCDIVMKGGITSGVVYPKAIVTLAKRFRFINLGGTSAGAIAAAAAAAAEYRRTVRGSDKGFEMVGDLGNLLAETPKGSSQTRLFSLFRPSEGTNRVFDVLTSAASGGKGALLTFLHRAMYQYGAAAWTGGAAGMVLGLLSVFYGGDGWLAWVWVAVGFLLAMVGAVIGVLVCMGREFIRAVPANNFGLCSGMPDPTVDNSGGPPLTAWLTEYLNEVAGFPAGHRPLIFKDLWDCADGAAHPERRKVNLEMMTTCLTHGRPYRLPFRNDEDLDENHLFYFREDEFRRLFPDSVVEWMKKNPQPIDVTGKKESSMRRNSRTMRAGVIFLCHYRKIFPWWW